VVRLARLVTPEGMTMDDWRIAAELALRFGTDFGLDTVEDVQDEIARVAPAYAGVDALLLGRARDGAVVPIADFPGEIVFHPVAGVSANVSWEPIRPTPAIASDPDSDTAESDTGDAAAAIALPDAPSPDLYDWDREAQAPGAVPPDAYSLRLVAARTLYDAGRITASSPSLSSLAPGPALVVHPNDLARVGVAAEGDTVRATSARGTIEVPVRTDTAVAPGTCFMPFAQSDTVGPNDLIDVTMSVTELRVETTR
jgi:predicted molibdopterin-dependent oxidoreductase YjgC